MQHEIDQKPLSLRDSMQWIRNWFQAMPVIVRIMVMTIVLGMVTHGFVYCNTLIGHDNILLYSGYQTNPPRWATQLFYAVRAYLQLPWVIGLIALLELGIVNVLLARLFSLTRLVSQFLLVITVVTYPSVIAFHNYGAVDIFTGSLLFSVLAVYFFQRRGIFNFLGAAVSMVISIASYQAFVCTTASLMLLVLLNRLIKNQEHVKSVVLGSLKALLIIALSIAVYYIVFRILVNATAYEVTTYRNQDKMGIFTADQLFVWLKATYKTILYYYTSIKLNPLPLWVSILLLACVTVVTVALFIRLLRERFFTKPAAPILAFVLVAVLPLAINGMQLLNSGLVPHILMTFSFITPWLFVLNFGEWLLDGVAPSGYRMPSSRIIATVCVAMMCVNAFYGYILANADYMGRKMNYDASLSLATRLVSRIESVPGYQMDTRVVLLGSLFTPFYSRQREGFEMANMITGSYSHSGQAITYNDQFGSTIQWFIQTALSSNMVFVPVGDLAVYKNNTEVKALEPYPAQACYLWVNDVLVMKLSDM